MKVKAILKGALALCLAIPAYQHISAEATRDKTLDQMITDSFVVINEDGSSRTILAETISSDDEISVQDKYEVVTAIGGDVVEEFSSEEEALEAVTTLEETSGEQLEVQPFTLKTVSNGVVYVKSSGVTEYKNVMTGQAGYTHGGFGRDGAFLGEFNGKIRAKYAGVIADFNPSDVNVVTYTDDTRTNYYIEKNGFLMHYYLYGAENIYGSTRVGYELDYLEDGVKYYSYDGHYFYKNYNDMISDYQEGTYSRAVNKDNPYYNYFQYISHRVTTDVTAESLDAFTKDIIGLTSYQTSKMKDLGASFVENQHKYTVNALLMFGVAANESDWGRSTIARNKNNLFGHGAIDSNPYWGSNGYESPQHSVEYHAYYFVSRGYLDYGDWRYNGAHVGDKETGMNVNYASDPYWGEKAASRAYFLDKEVTNYQHTTLGIIEGKINGVKLYNEPSVDSVVITTLKSLSNLPVYVLDEVEVNGEMWYKIASDTSINDARNAHDYSLIYNIEDDYVYIPASYVRIVSESILNNTENENQGTENEQEPTITIPNLEAGHQIVLNEKTFMTEANTTIADMLLVTESAIIKKGETIITDPNATVGTGYTIEIGDDVYTIVKLGDLTGDGVVNTADSLTMTLHITGKKLIENTSICDLNNDGSVNTADSLTLTLHLTNKKLISIN